MANKARDDWSVSASEMEQGLPGGEARKEAREGGFWSGLVCTETACQLPHRPDCECDANSRLISRLLRGLCFGGFSQY